MTQNELEKELLKLGMPVAYSHFDVDPDNPTPIPFITYLLVGKNDFIADNRNYLTVNIYDVELYTDHKDLETEKLVEDKLKELEIPFDKIETWISEEELYQVVYEIQII